MLIMDNFDIKRLKNKKLFLFDIDGTIRLGNKILDGVFEFFDYIKCVGGKYIFITNNSSKSQKDYKTHFCDLGFDVCEQDFVTALSVTTDYLKTNHAKDKIFVVGTNSLKSELAKNDLIITDNIDETQVLLVGYDCEFTYSKAVDACKILQTKQVCYLATNQDLKCPVDFGFIPDCGAIVDFIEKATNKRPLFLGKPSPQMIFSAIKGTKYTEDEVLVVGDRLYTDILSAVNAKVDSCLVLTGDATLESLNSVDYKPTYVFDDVKRLFEAYKGN